VIAPAKARQSALRQLVSTFFEGSPLAAAAALLEMSDHKLSAEERDHLSALITRREKEGRWTAVVAFGFRQPSVPVTPHQSLSPAPNNDEPFHKSAELFKSPCRAALDPTG
jgi:hypothetical protein